MRLILVRRGMSVLSLLGSDKEANEKEDGRSDDNTRSDSDVEAITNKSPRMDARAPNPDERSIMDQRLLV